MANPTDPLPPPLIPIPLSLQVYNTCLRRFPSDSFLLFRDGGNLFPTTIFALVSAVVKISRVMKLLPGTPLYRGLGGAMDLPHSFSKVDRHGCSGFLDWGFMSTTSSLATAVEYSGAKQDRPLPMVRAVSSDGVRQ